MKRVITECTQCDKWCESDEDQLAHFDYERCHACAQDYIAYMQTEAGQYSAKRIKDITTYLLTGK